MLWGQADSHSSPDSYPSLMSLGHMYLTLTLPLAFKWGPTHLSDLGPVQFIEHVLCAQHYFRASRYGTGKEGQKALASWNWLSADVRGSKTNMLPIYLPIVLAIIWWLNVFWKNKRGYRYWCGFNFEIQGVSLGMTLEHRFEGDAGRSYRVPKEEQVQKSWGKSCLGCLGSKDTGVAGTE